MRIEVVRVWIYDFRTMSLRWHGRFFVRKRSCAHTGRRQVFDNKRLVVCLVVRVRVPKRAVRVCVGVFDRAGEASCVEACVDLSL